MPATSKKDPACTKMLMLTEVFLYEALKFQFTFQPNRLEIMYGFCQETANSQITFRLKIIFFGNETRQRLENEYLSCTTDVSVSGRAKYNPAQTTQEVYIE